MTNSARIEELESQLAAAKSDIEALTLQRDEAEEDRDEKDLELTRMTAHAERLREALVKIEPPIGPHDSPEYHLATRMLLAREALAATPAQSLEAHDREVRRQAWEDADTISVICDPWDSDQDKAVMKGWAEAREHYRAAILGSATEQSEGSLGPKDFASKSDARQNKEDK